MKPYFEDEHVTLYHGDCREIIPALDVAIDLVVADPPYGVTSLSWDDWCAGWLPIAGAVADSMWCFGSLAMFMARAADFRDAGWTLSHEIIWRKHNGSDSRSDRFRRIHEHAVHFYRGAWGSVYHEAQYVMGATARQVRSKAQPTHWNTIARTAYEAVDGGPKLATSVIDARSMHGTALHPTEKPAAVLAPLIKYATPPYPWCWTRSLDPAARSTRHVTRADARSGSRSTSAIASARRGGSRNASCSRARRDR